MLNNPGHIAPSDTYYKGQIVEGDKLDFLNAFFGIRAIMKILLTRKHHHKADTLVELMAPWQLTPEQIMVVANIGKIKSPHLDEVDLYNRDVATLIIEGLITALNDECLYGPDDIRRAVCMAF